MRRHGSIKQRGDGVWLISITLGYRPDGKREREHHTFHGTRRQAEDECTRLHVEAQRRGARPTSDITLGEWAAQYLERAQKRTSPATQHNYRDTLRLRILPALGNIRLSKLTPQQIQQFYLQLAEQNLAGATQRLYHLVLSALLQEALYLGYIPSNPARAVRPPRVERSEPQYYDEEDIRALLAAIVEEPPRFRALVQLALFTGMRRGEIIALKWADMDLAKSAIRVRAGAVRSRGERQVLRTTKTASSRRVVLIPSATLQALIEWRNEQQREHELAGESWIDSGGMIFTGPSGEWLYVDTPTKEWREFLDRHRLPRIRLHGLRHTCASLLIASGVDIRSVAAALGHSNTSTTLNVYGHLMDASARRAALALEDVQRRLGNNLGDNLGDNGDK
jgi:integrase